DATVSRTGGLVASESTPPRPHSRAPLLDEERNALDFALLVEEGRTRQCRGRVVLWRLNPHHHPPACAGTPPPRGGECVGFFALLVESEDGWMDTLNVCPSPDERP